MALETTSVDRPRLFIPPKHDRISYSYERRYYDEHIEETRKRYGDSSGLTMVAGAVDMDNLHLHNAVTGGYQVGDEGLRTILYDTLEDSFPDVLENAGCGKVEMIVGTYRMGVDEFITVLLGKLTITPAQRIELSAALNAIYYPNFAHRLDKLRTAAQQADLNSKDLSTSNLRLIPLLTRPGLSSNNLAKVASTDYITRKVGHIGISLGLATWGEGYTKELLHDVAFASMHEDKKRRWAEYEDTINPLARYIGKACAWGYQRIYRRDISR